MKKLKITVIAVAAVVTLSLMVSGMGEAIKVKKGEDAPVDRQLADQLVGSVFQAYRNFSIPAFMDIVSEDYSPDRMQLINTIGDSYYKILIINIDYFMDKVMGGNGTTAVLFSWQKSVQNKSTGAMVNTEGDATFVFKNQDGDWKLVRIHGRNPLL